jgi:O-acetyl-ADP-ribose deacetylase (regulator of RNase III)
MMITYVRTNIFESSANVLVNTVNTVGVMGKGLAKEFKRIYPDMFKIYQKFCEEGALTTGKLQLYKTTNKWIINFPTKANWRSPSKLEYVEQGLQKFVENYERLGIKSISFPMLGCGNGGLSWEDEVKPLMEKYLDTLPIDVFIHIAKKDSYKPEHKNQAEIDTWLHSSPRELSALEFITDLKKRYSGLMSVPLQKYDLVLEVNLENIEGEDFYCITHEKTKLCIDEIALIDIWQALRSYGILKQEMLSAELAAHSALVMIFLAELDYIVLTEIGDDESIIAARLLSHKQPVKDEEEIFFVA